jgi:hypothetical protein
MVPGRFSVDRICSGLVAAAFVISPQNNPPTQFLSAAKLFGLAW